MGRIPKILISLLGAASLGAQEPALKPVACPLSAEDFANPERGWYRYREMPLSGGFDFAVRNTPGSLVFLKIRADAHRAAALPQSLLDRLQAAFDQARKDGIKLIPRVAYNDGPSAGCAAEYGCDAPKAIILQHIAQLAPLWKRNKDVIHLIDPGFIGGWGEWHTSSNGLDNKKDRTDILFAILDSLPADRMVYIRYPGFKREIFGGSLSSESEILGPDRAFNRSRIARVGHLNDCLLSSEDDVGTYQHTNWPRAREVAYVGGESRFAPYGGESCALHARGECASALSELAALHIDHLNRDYHTGVIDRWKTQGCLDTISRKLGHRLALASAEAPDAVRPGGILRLRLVMRNLGFGELFNPRDVEVVLRQGAREEAAVLPVDPRLWTGGTSDTVDVSLAVPAALPAGTWKLGLRLADKDTALRKDPRYSIRLANEGFWDAAAGINDLKADFRIDASAPGAADPGRQRFEVITPGTWVRFDALGDAAGGWRLIRRDASRLELVVPRGGTGPVTVKLITLSGTLIREYRLAFRGPEAGVYSLDTRGWLAGPYLLSATRGRDRATWSLLVRRSGPPALD